MAEKQLWLEPDYFNDFHCKGGACRNSCCSGWDIAIGMNEYFRLIGLDCDKELHHRLECAFRVPQYPAPERYRLISPNWLGRCPLQNEDGLCALHCACGEAALPEVCRVYPRSFKREGSHLQACCSNSCEAVVEMLMREDRLSFNLVEMDAAVEIGEDTSDDIGPVIHRCVTLLQDRKAPLDHRIRAICRDFDAEKPFLRDEAALNRCVEILAEICSASPNLCRFAEAALERYTPENGWTGFSRDLRNLEQRQPLWERHFENLLANHIIYADFPQTDGRLSHRDACAGLCLLYSLMLVITAAYTAENADENAFADGIAAIFHLAEHSAYYYNARVLTGGDWILV